MIKKLTKIMKGMVYVKKTSDDKRFETFNLGDKIPILKNYRILYWPNSIFDKNDQSEYWFERRRGEFGGDAIITIKCREFNSLESMACMILSAINLSKRA